MLCANCGELGHAYKRCKGPVTSFGIVCIRLNEAGKSEYLMVQRKDSLAYVEIIRGKYATDNVAYIRHLVGLLTLRELQLIAACDDFDQLWCLMWQVENSIASYRREYEVAKQKFDSVKATIRAIATEAIDVGAYFTDTEWGFAKGRRNIGENDFECASREFYEETGVPHSIGIVRLSDVPVMESFVGTNGVHYKHVYFIATIPTLNREAKLTPQTTREVSNVSWFTFDDMKRVIRPYNRERLSLVRDVDARLTAGEFTI